MFLGPPGSGKGTYSSYLSVYLDVPHISTGEMLREVVESGSELGKKIDGFLDRGELVSDDIMIEIFKRRILMDDTKNGFVLDGFPRTITQAKMLDEMHESIGCFDYIFSLWTPYDQIIKRALKRAQCDDCGKIYNLKNSPPKIDGVCDICGGKIVDRDDDNEKILHHRLKVYDEITKPLVEYYSDRDSFYTIYSGGPAQEGNDEITGIIGKTPKGES